MKIVDQTNTRENRFDMFAAWDKVVNWDTYEYSDLQLKRQIKHLIVCLWNEKDWTIRRYPDKAKEIETYINNSRFIKIIADLANSIKHGSQLRSPRSNSKQTDYYGKVTLNNKISRRMSYIKSDGHIFEIFEVLRGAIDEYGNLEIKLNC